MDTFVLNTILNADNGQNILPSKESQEALLHIWKCTDCTNELDIAEYTLSLALQNGGTPNGSNLMLVKMLHKIFIDEHEPSFSQLILFIDFLKFLLNSPFMSGLKSYRRNKSSGIKTRQFKLRKRTHTSSECAICLGKYEDSQTLRCVKQCSHEFHAVCIDEWLKEKSTCPMCRQSIWKQQTFNWCIANK